MARQKFAQTVFPYDESPRRMAEFHGEPATELHLTLWDLFSRTASTYPAREAVVSMWQPSSNASSSASSSRTTCIRWTYRDLSERVAHLASSLRKLGCRPGMKLAALVWNGSEWALFLWAAAKLNLVFSPIDPRVPEESRAMINILKPDVIVVQGEEEAKLVDADEEIKAVASVYVQCASTRVSGWSRLSDLLTLPAAHDNLRFGGCSWSDSHPESPVMVVFTSGTTGKPKGCAHTSRNLISQTFDYDPNPDPTLIDRWLVHTPVSHVFAINNALRAWRYGGAVILPSRSFDVETTAKALIQEQCTIMSATPTLVKAILESTSRPSRQDISLRLVSIAATKITAEDIRLCQKILGARDAIQAYGMSEGAPVISWRRNDPLLASDYSLGAGKVLPGASIRVCNYHSHEVVGLNEVGELHIGGSSVITGYLNDLTAEAYYDDDCGRWFKTGDQAVVDDNGVVQILGRYKDLIIRGGENLDPGKIEVALTSLDGVQAWVVGVRDRLAGELPVAVVQLPDGVSKAQIRQRAAQLGARYALASVYRLEELGFGSVPMTSLGKVRKGRLREAVERIDAQPSWESPQRKTSPSTTQHTQVPRSPRKVSATFQAKKKAPERESRPNLTAQLLHVWEDLTACRVSPAATMDHFADSITILRYCDAVFRSCGRRLYLQDVVEHNTIEQQARLLQRREPNAHRNHTLTTGVVSPTSADGIEQSPPPNYAEIGIMSEAATLGPKLRKLTQRRSTRVNLLWGEACSKIASLGLDISLIEDVVPVRIALHRMVDGQRPQSYFVRTTFCVRDASGRQIRHGLEKTLRGRAMLRTALLRPSSGGFYHVVLRSDNQLLKQLISEIDATSEQDARKIWQHDSPRTNAPLMFHAKVIRVHRSNTTYLSLSYNHSVIDALSLWSWHQELDLSIGDIAVPAWTLTPYRLFADLFSQYRNSVPAQDAVAFHVRRLRGISLLKTALWPQQRSPGWMISSDRDSKLAQARAEIREQVWNGEWADRAQTFRLPRLARIVCLPQLRQLIEQGIDPSLFAKGAVVMFNVLATGASHALFNTWESGRSWPFVPQWMEQALPPAMSIDGPTVQWMLNMVEVDPSEQLGVFMRRMSDEAKEMKKFEHAPWEKIIKGLRDEGDVAMDASFRQSFVWDLSLGLGGQKRSQSDQGVFNCLEPVERMDWADCGLFWNAFMIDRDNLYFVASWDTAQMNDVEVEVHCDRMADVMRKMGNRENWDRTVSDVFMGGRASKEVPISC